MDAPPATGQSFLVVWLIRIFLASTVALLFTRSSQLRNSLLPIFIALSCVTPLAFSWLLAVTKNVPEPYLDEVFHIPQAQVYCQGRYLEWDDKITTPPGLYIATIVFNEALGLPCSFYHLRAFNVFVVSCISALILICKARLSQTSLELNSPNREISVRDILTGINTAFFPVLFFFSGLYYTDPASTLIVLLAYANHLTRVGASKPSFLNDVYSIILGVLALGFRQTNIFWVVIYMAGLEVIHSIKTLNPTPVDTPTFQTVSEQVKFYVWRYSLGDIHDPSLSLALPIDVAICVVSIGIAAISNLPTVLRRFLWPHGIVLAAFAAFVAWNGGVVLGDKSNHVATLHLAQLLYIWPFFAFFSAPLFIPKLLNFANTVYRAFKAPITPNSSSHTSFLTHPLITALVGCAAISAGLLIVHFNTIIHPFTLADNRHYVFYVFRYSILRAWWIRYALIPIYIVCAWLCWGALQGGPEPSEDFSTGGKWIQSPFTTSSIPSTKKASSSSKGQKNAGEREETNPDSPSPCASTALMLLLATTLSLATAPLVEPRYFILPWVFWRLLVPTHPTTSLNKQQSTPISPSVSVSIPILLLETAWFALVNAATMYVFVTRPFYWRAPDGTLQDDGRVQRFMW